MEDASLSWSKARYIWVSSAKKWAVRPCDWMMLSSGDLQSTKYLGPSTESWGTLHISTRSLLFYSHQWDQIGFYFDSRRQSTGMPMFMLNLCFGSLNPHSYPAPGWWPLRLNLLYRFTFSCITATVNRVRLTYTALFAREYICALSSCIIVIGLFQWHDCGKRLFGECSITWWTNVAKSQQCVD